MTHRQGPLALLPFLLSGCFNLSGLPGSDKFSCAAPDGVSCMSVSGVSENIMAGTFDNAATKPNMVPTADAGDFSRAKKAAIQHVVPGMPLRTPPRVVRVWFKDFEDSDEDLISELYTYLTLDTGRWQIDRARRRLAPSVALKPPVADTSKLVANDPLPTTTAATSAGAIKFPPVTPVPNPAAAAPTMPGAATSGAH